MPAWKRPESVLVMLISTRGETLLLCRKEPRGFWQSVTGSLGAGESAQAAACRELAEETGLEANDTLAPTGKIVEFPILPEWRHRYEPGVRTNREHQFVMRVAAARPILLSRREHCAYAWVSPDEAIRRAASWSNRDAFQSIPDTPA